MYHLARIIGHRGVAGLAAENTLASIRLAAARGFRWIEIDVRPTRDGIAVLSHDDSLQRCMADPRRISRLAASTAEAIGVPSLHEVMSLIKALSLGVIVEIKANKGEAEKAADATMAVIRETSRHCMISSFSAEVLVHVRRRYPKLPLAWNMSAAAEAWQHRQKKLNLANVHIWHKQLTAAHIEPMKRAGLGVYCFTVNDARRRAALFAQGADGVFSDFPPPDKKAGAADTTKRR